MTVEFLLNGSRELVRLVVCRLFRYCAVNYGARVFLQCYGV